ncbi:CheB methylesterase domain-containing protein [Xinfangfangia sp. CPCC 101601]|uniref:protein-glutamate methylesterase n=1 Tax=Pseudogemmobacter lacusdianii TaxID=3069608 RepID=A0ABU0VZ48_9RHOB|nr:CheB methylesterase domain-containing protein [Xinfangfangia sp. CPCC 101601]MDQ2067032.1 CheB methylesterase domain-containing protein [Xinfangfangia sp. CPCC 101601]
MGRNLHSPEDDQPLDHCYASPFAFAELTFPKLLSEKGQQAMTEIATVIVTSSPLLLSRLGRALGRLPRVKLCGQAGDLSGAYIRVEQAEPKIVLLGSEMTRHPDFPGLLAMFRVMGITWLRIGNEAARPGASEAVLNPEDSPEAMLTSICNALAKNDESGSTMPLVPRAPLALGRGRPDRFILIGSSTGGIDALLRVLSVFPADCPPTAIVQHTGSSFSDSLIRLLDRSCAAQVRPAQPGLPLVPGQVVVGAGCGAHMLLNPGPPPKVQLAAGEPVSGHLPSVDELFRSAVPIATRVTAALLTGMGRDGAQGMLELRRAGAFTIAQDEASSVVYGMPRAAWELGAVESRLPLMQIGPELLNRCTGRAMSVVGDRKAMGATR